MANTYTKNNLELIFAVKYSVAMIDDSWEPELYKYLTQKIEEKNHKIIVINGTPDHIHILLTLNPNQSVSDLLQMAKGYSSGWINAMDFTNTKFAWQDGYAAFSHHPNQQDEVINYINNQKELHKRMTLSEEIVKYFEIYGIVYDKRYILKEPE